MYYTISIDILDDSGLHLIDKPLYPVNGWIVEKFLYKSGLRLTAKPLYPANGWIVENFVMVLFEFSIQSMITFGSGGVI